MNDDSAPEASRDYYEVTVQDGEWDLVVPLSSKHPVKKWPRPATILTRGLVYPQRTYICSSVPSQWVQWLGCLPVFPEGVEVPKVCLRWWIKSANESYNDRPGDYFSYGSCIRDSFVEPSPMIGDVFLSVSERYTVKNKSGTPEYQRAANWMDNKAAKYFKPTLHKERYYGRADK